MIPDGRTWRSVVAVAVGVGAAAAVLGVVIYVSVTRDIAFGIFTGDSSRAVVDDWYAGLLSDLGVAIWALGALAALIAALTYSGRSRSDSAFFTAMGLVTAWLAADDAFLWHEELIPDTFGVDEKIVFIVYAVVAVVAVIAGRRTIARHLWWVLATACALLGGSIFAERAGFAIRSDGDTVGVLKFLGIAAWTAFFVEAAIHGRRRPSGAAVVIETTAWPPPRAEDAIVGQNLSR